MSESNSAECPICGKTFPMSTINKHVDDCLDASGTSGKDAPENNTKPAQTASQKKPNVVMSSFFSPGKRSKDLESNSQAKCLKKSPKLQKRDLSNLAGKSDTSPPGKRAKLDSKHSSSIFFQKSKETVVSGNSSNEKNSKLIDMPKSMTDPASKPTRAASTKSTKEDFVPLAEKMRPCSLQDYVGQSKILGENSLLRSLLEANEVPSMILWGPPGCGKTSLAHIIANNAKKGGQSRFVTLSATTSGINDVKEVIKVAKNEQKMFKRKTILFMDEIHRFNKSQQDTFLPHVENGTITLIGATTENPSFQLNTALLSRCRVIVLEKLATESLQRILLRAVKSMGCIMEGESGNDSDYENDAADLDKNIHVVVKKDAIIALSNFCDGDARAALNGLQLAVQSRIAKAQQSNEACNSENEDSKFILKTNIITTVDVSDIKEGLQRTHVLYDKKGEEHYNIISALHKSIRGSDANAALYWLARMLAGGEDPLYVARRLVRMASEDIGLADPEALTQTVAAYQACHFIGMPECDVILAQAAVYLARAPKSIEVYKAYNNAKKCVKEWDGPHPSVPLHIRNAPTKLMKDLGYGAGYKYNPDYDEPVEQSYLPPELEHVDFF